MNKNESSWKKIRGRLVQINNLAKVQNKKRLPRGTHGPGQPEPNLGQACIFSNWAMFGLSDSKPKAQPDPAGLTNECL